MGCVFGNCRAAKPLRPNQCRCMEKPLRSAGRRIKTSSTCTPLPAGNADEMLKRISGVASPAQRVPAKWRWHYKVLLSLQDRLLRDREELRQDVARPLEAHSMDEADSASDEFDHNLALTQLSAEQDELREVTEALQRIQSGRYGICEETGKRLPAARLKAIPWARFTREVEERLEKAGSVPSPRLQPATTVRSRGGVRFAPEEEEENEVEELSESEESSSSAEPASPDAGETTRKVTARPPANRRAASKQKGQARQTPRPPKSKRT